MKLFVFLTSRVFAIFLLAISALLLTIWRGNPQYFSRAFLVVPAFVFISISICIVKRFLAVGSRRNLKFWGSVVFHIGLLVIIAAASLGPIIRFWATVVLPQGKTVNMGDKTFAVIRNIPVSGAIPDMLIKMEEYKASYADDRFPIDYATQITVLLKENDIYRQRVEAVRINAPLWLGGYQFMLDSGSFSPKYILKDKDGHVLFSQFLDLSNATSEEDKFEIPEAGMEVYTRFFPDMYKEGNLYGSRSPYPKNPAFGLRIIYKDNPFKEIWKGVLKKGEKAEFEGLSLEFADLQQVAILQVLNDPTYWGIFTGWLLIAGGLMVRYLPLEKALRWKVNEVAAEKFMREKAKDL